MGLDITAYPKLTFVRPLEDGEDPYPQISLYQHDGFPQRSDGLAEGVYESDGAAFGFRAGSYSGYNEWRRLLAAMLGTTPEKVWGEGDTGRAFCKLINFGDNEGFIGPETSRLLAAEFGEWQERAEEYAKTIDDGDWFLAKFRDWRKAFELAAGSGAVEFH